MPLTADDETDAQWIELYNNGGALVTAGCADASFQFH